MLSIENQPDPLCSYKITGLKSDERASDDTLALEEADLLKSGLTDDKHLPTFSIRDYALTSRRKGIERNWPFPQQYLELCLKHGIRDILPPFEPPDLVRKYSSGKGTVESGELVCVNGRKRIVDVDLLEQEKVVLNCVLNRSCLPIEQSDLDLSDQAQSSVQVQEKLTLRLAGTDFCRLSRSPGFEGSGKEVISTVNSSGQSERERISFNRLPCSGDVGTSSSKALIEEAEVSEAPSALQKIGNTIESPSKKCRLIEKLGNLSDPSCVEDIVASTTTTISEPMSSKVCPVCKTFLSTSNTTLNAHIDQCLAMESTSKWAVNSKLSKIKVKPRKKRLMVDIYATAPRCTLEELDRRNGTNWAADSSLPTADAGVCAEGKRQRLSQEFPEDASDDNAVYFDSNGKKLRILSKLDGASLPRVGEDFGPRKHANENRESNICFPGKVRRLGLKEKPLKVKPQSRKLCSLKPDRPEIYEAAPEGRKYGLDENCDKEESLSEILKARDQLNPGELRQWVCSKRTGLSKKVNGKDGRQGPGYSSIMTRDPLIENNQTHFGNSSRETGSSIVKLPNPLQNSSSSPTSRRIERPSHGVQIIDKGERSQKPPECHLNRFNDGSTSTSVGSVLKFSNFSRNHAASPRSKRVEVRSGLAENSNGLPKMTVNPSETCHHFSPKGKKLSNSRKSMLLIGPSSPKSTSTVNERCSFLRKPRMHGSITETSQQVRAVISDVDREYDQMSDSTENHSDSSDSSESLRRHEELHDEVSIGRNDLLESGHGRETSRTLGRVEVEPRALESLKSGAEEVPVNGKDSIIGQYAETSAQIPIIRSSETLISELHRQASPSNTRSNCFESIEEHERSLCRTEAQMGSTEESFCDDQEPGSAEEVGNGNRVGGSSFSETGYTECGTEPISIPGPPGSFLPSPGDISSEIIVENSSLTSNRLPSSQDQYFLVDRDSSGSPVSATSTISHSQTSRSDSKYVESTSFAGARADLEKFVSGFSDSNTKLNIVEETERINFDGESLKAATISTAEGSLKFSDDHPCHCSRKETMPWSSSSLTYQDSQLPRQQNMTPATAILPSVMNYNHKIWPEVFTTSSGCPSSNINEKVPMMDSSRSCVTSSMASPDTAGKFPGHHDNYVSASSSSQAYQSTSNPVLRLMGKNLMIVNNEEDASVELKEAPPVSPNIGRANAKYPTLQGFSIGNISTDHQNHVSFYHVVPDGSVIFSHDPPPAPSNPSRRVGNHNNIHLGDFMGAVLPQQNGSKLDRNDLQTHQESRPSSTSIDRWNSSHHHHQLTYNVHRGAFAAPQLRQQFPCFGGEAAAPPNSSREVIVIDDSPENEANLSIKYSTQGSKLASPSPSPVGVLPLDPNSSRQVNHPFLYCYPSQNSYTTPVAVAPYPVMMCPRGTINNSPPKLQGDSLYAFIPKQR